MEKKDIRSDLLKSFGMESRAFTWLEEIKRNVSSDEKMYNLTVGSPATLISGKRWRSSIRSATTSLLIRLPR